VEDEEMVEELDATLHPEDKPDDEAIGVQRCFDSEFFHGLGDVHGKDLESEVTKPTTRKIKYEMLEEPINIHLALAISTAEWGPSNTYSNTTYAEIRAIW